jgi:dTDP-4-dehydrorhamnose 3,5-epimerase
VKITKAAIPDILIIEPAIFTDKRGFFFESWNDRDFRNEVGSEIVFVQDNQAFSYASVLRGLHYQIQQPQGKLVRVVRGRVMDVAVDIRKSSPTFGQWFATELSEQNHRNVWIPVGFAHGYYVLSESAECLYKATDYYAPTHERTIAWNDPTIAIKWPYDIKPVLSAKDRVGKLLRDAEIFP